MEQYLIRNCENLLIQKFQSPIIHSKIVEISEITFWCISYVKTRALLLLEKMITERTKHKITSLYNRCIPRYAQNLKKQSQIINEFNLRFDSRVFHLHCDECVFYSTKRNPVIFPFFVFTILIWQSITAQQYECLQKNKDFFSNNIRYMRYQTVVWIKTFVCARLLQCGIVITIISVLWI